MTPELNPGDTQVADAQGADERAIEDGRLLFAQECRFIWGAHRLDQLPPEGAPEVAFAGRSNVGKSSLINALTGRNTLARTSNTPGRTQQLNFFDLGGRLTLVDLPGYGYAKVSKSLSAAWRQVLRGYLAGRVPLARCCLLIDGRHGLKDTDHDILSLLDEAAVSTRVILTKGDKVRGSEREERMAAVAAGLKRHPAAFPEPVITSAEKGEGIAALRASLAGLAAPASIG